MRMGHYSVYFCALAKLRRSRICRLIYTGTQKKNRYQYVIGLLYACYAYVFQKISEEK